MGREVTHHGFETQFLLFLKFSLLFFFLSFFSPFFFFSFFLALFFHLPPLPSCLRMAWLRKLGHYFAQVITCPFRGWPFGAIPRSKPIESADYSAVNNARARAHANSDYRRFRQYRGFLRWTIFFITGIACAGMYRIIFYLIDLITKKKFAMLEDRIEHDDMTTAFATYFTIMVVLVLGSMLFVLWAPSAGGGGVPEVRARCN